VKHSNKAVRLLPDGVRSKFPKRSDTLAKRKKKKTVTLMRSTTVTLHFPDKTLFERCHKVLIQERCDIEMNREDKTISYAGSEQEQINSALKTLGKEYVIRVKDSDS